MNKLSKCLFNEPIAEYTFIWHPSDVFHDFYQRVTIGFNHGKFKNSKIQPLLVLEGCWRFVSLDNGTEKGFLNYDMYRTPWDLVKLQALMQEVWCQAGNQACLTRPRVPKLPRLQSEPKSHSTPQSGKPKGLSLTCAYCWQRCKQPESEPVPGEMPGWWAILERVNQGHTWATQTDLME